MRGICEKTRELRVATLHRTGIDAVRARSARTTTGQVPIAAR
jgi:hypothetical protein